jgi:hypothetical protein
MDNPGADPPHGGSLACVGSVCRCIQYGELRWVATCRIEEDFGIGSHRRLREHFARE